MPEKSKTDLNKESEYTTQVPTTVELAKATDKDIITKLSKDLKVGYFTAEEQKVWATQTAEMFEELFRRNFELTDLLDEILAHRMEDK